MTMYLLFFGRLNKEVVLYLYSLTHGTCNVYCYLFKMKKKYFYKCHANLNFKLCKMWFTYKNDRKLEGKKLAF